MEERNLLQWLLKPSATVFGPNNWPYNFCTTGANAFLSEQLHQATQESPNGKPRTSSTTQKILLLFTKKQTGWKYAKSFHAGPVVNP